MVYIQAKTAKDGHNGLDLFVHQNSVLDSSIAVNDMGGYGLDNNILRWFSIVHDLGKANPLFLSNMLKITDAREVCCRHEISSVLFIDIVPEDIRDIVALLVLSHHKSMCCNDERGLKKICDIDGYDDEWFSKSNKTLWNHIDGIDNWGKNVIVFLKEHYGINAQIPTLERCKEILYKYATMELSNGYSEYRGVCMMADHIASAFEDDTDRIIQFTKLYKTPDISFYNSKDEKYPLSLIDSDPTKKHTFCTAPCGCGKTNFMMKRCTKRIFYVLPYQASINAMQKRIQKDITDEYNVGIKHASYKSLSFIDDDTKTLSNLFGLPVKVMTPFQIMPIIFRLKGYESVIMDMKGQDVILDEIHTYTDKNRTCVIELIKILKEIGCNIHICTATMPTALKEIILDIIGRENTQIVNLSSDVMSSFNRHIVHTCDMFDEDEIKKRYKNGEKILIVRNQIKAARSMYLYLKTLFEDAKIMLIHSAYERSRRAELESILMDEFNKKNEPCIVVSTQVVEVSIDINFDVMFTDCSDIMSLIQRFGRINRQRTNIGLLKDVYVINASKDNSFLPYNAEVCKSTFEELGKIDGKVLDENYVQDIIDNIYGKVTLTNFDMANPYEDGEWKSEMYCHNVNESIASTLEFSGYICVRESKVDEYVNTKNIGLEIPLSSHKKSKVENFKTIDSNNLKGKNVYIVPDALYTDEVGLMI